MSVRFHIDISDGEEELDRIIHGPPPGVILALETVLAESFAETQMVVHVITGSLKASGKIESDFQNGKWTGTITYGGLSPGSVNDPVKYAGHEQARGLSHQYMWPAWARSRQYGEIIEDWLAGELR